MGFYGNITNTSRTQFQFDKIYPSRTDMDALATIDGIYQGRYVLVNYEEENYLDHFKLAYKVTVNNEIKFYYSYNAETAEGQEYIYTTDENNHDLNALKPGNFIRITPNHNLRDPNTDRDEFWKVTGSYTVGPQLDANEQIIANTTFVYCKYTQYTDSFAVYYNKDVDNYGTSRGYDSTVWQKVYQDGVDKYVMVAELNTVVPTFDLEPDAPRMVPLQPHFDASSTNVYYKLHWAPAWGFRIKAADPTLIGPELMVNGIATSINQKMSSDPTEYLSDEKTTWHNIVSNNGVDTDYVFAAWKKDPHAAPGTATSGTWVPSTPTLFSDDLSNIEELPAAIYYNKDGFDPKNISYGFIPVTITADDYKPNKFYILKDRMYELCKESYFNTNKQYYSKIEDHISLQPTGYSGHTYNTHDGGVTKTAQVDTQEMSIILPSIGNMVAACWDLMYGNASVNNGNIRNLDVTWETARGDLARNGLRLVTDFNLEAGQYAYQTKNVETVAGAINSMHDLLGMIITAAPQSELTNASTLEDLDINRIYYDTDRKRFYRKREGYIYRDFENYNYREIEVTSDTYLPSTYYYLSNGEYVVDDSENYTSGRTYFGRYIPATQEYERHSVNEFTNFDGSKYCYADYTELVNSTTTPEYRDYVKDPKYQSDKTYYYWEEENVPAGQYQYPDGHVNTEAIRVKGITDYAELIDLADEYIPNTYHYEVADGYEIDTSETAVPGRVYYKFIPANAHTVVGDAPQGMGYHNIYMPGRYLYPKENTYVKINVADQNAFDALIVAGKELYTYDPSNSSNPYPRAMTYAGAVQYYELVPSGYEVDTHPVMNTKDNGEYELRTYYLLDTNNQRIIDDKIYNKKIIYKRYALEENAYVSGVYYYWSNSSISEPANKDDGSFNEDENYTLDTTGSYVSSRNYYMRIETLELVQTSYYVVDENNPLSLIQYHDNEFYSYDQKTGKLTVVNSLTDLTQLDLSNVYVLRNGLNANGTHQLSENDFTNASVTALLRQSNVYYTPNTYHRITELQLDASGEIVLDEHGHGIQTSYSDLILDDYPTKQKFEYYHIVIPENDPLMPISQSIKFFEAYKYYRYNEATNEYTLITSDTKPVDVDYVYVKNAYYVEEDAANVYPVGATWNLQTAYVPPSVTLGTRIDTWELVEIPDFARNMNTMHGLLLKINQALETNNKQTRDLRTIQGALNTLNDKIAMFGKWKSGQLVLVDDYGRLQSAEEIPNNWIEIITDTNVVNSKVGIRHKYNRIPENDIVREENLQQVNNASFSTVRSIRDDMGHEVNTETITYLLPHGYGKIAGNNGELAAGGTYATIKLEGSDNWIATAATTENDVKKIKITHTGPVETGATARGDTTNQTPSYGETFKVPSFSVDAKGHIALSGDHTVTIPSLGLSVAATGVSNDVITSLTYSSAGSFEKTSCLPANLVLNGYGEDSTSLDASKTIGQAFRILDTRITSENSTLAGRISTLESLNAGERLTSLEGYRTTLQGYNIDSRLTTLEGYDNVTDTTRLDRLEAGTVQFVYEVNDNKTTSAIQMAQDIDALTAALANKLDTPLTYTTYTTVISYQPTTPNLDPYNPDGLWVEDTNNPGEYTGAPAVYDSGLAYYVQVSEQVPENHNITINDIVQRLIAVENALNS